VPGARTTPNQTSRTPTVSARTVRQHSFPLTSIQPHIVRLTPSLHSALLCLSYRSINVHDNDSTSLAILIGGLAPLSPVRRLFLSGAVASGPGAGAQHRWVHLVSRPCLAGECGSPDAQRTRGHCRCVPSPRLVQFLRHSCDALFHKTACRVRQRACSAAPAASSTTTVGCGCCMPTGCLEPHCKESMREDCGLSAVACPRPTVCLIAFVRCVGCNEPTGRLLPLMCAFGPAAASLCRHVVVDPGVRGPRRGQQRGRVRLPRGVLPRKQKGERIGVNLSDGVSCIVL
jgi:hypothetical protein